MKDSRSILLLIVSVLLILVSCTLLWTWGYNFNTHERKKEKAQLPAVVKDTAVASSSKLRDSLQNIYTTAVSTINTLDTAWTNADSLAAGLDLRLNEFFKLRNEISSLLRNPDNKADVALAKQKTEELQKKIDQLRATNSNVERENQRLNAMLQQMMAGSTHDAHTGKNAILETGRSGMKANTPANVLASDVRLIAMMVDGNREQETVEALQTDKFVGSFLVKSNAAPLINSEIVVVVTQPDKKVLQTSAWESGRFETKDGQRIYSCRVKFDYAKGENKRLSFALNADIFQKGTYLLQLYYNGNLIGKLTKTLI